MTNRPVPMRLAACLIAILLPGGCAALAQPPTLVGTWLAEDIGGRGVIDRAQSTIEFDGEGGVYGSAGCNRFNGPADIRDGALTLGPLAATRRACAPALMDQEDKFLIALDSVRSYRFDGAFLFMSDEAGDDLLRFTRLE